VVPGYACGSRNGKRPSRTYSHMRLTGAWMPQMQSDFGCLRSVAQLTSMRRSLQALKGSAGGAIEKFEMGLKIRRPVQHRFAAA
jgi:hypothetical protein